MKPLKIIYNTLKGIADYKEIPAGIDKEVADSLVQLGLVENPWDYELTADGSLLMKLLEALYV